LVKEFTGSFDNGLGAVLIGEYSLALFLYRSIGAIKLRDRHGGTCFDCGRPARRGAALDGRPHHPGDRCSPTTGRHG
jgi:hypothetical protein